MSRWFITLVAAITCCGCQLQAQSNLDSVPALLTESDLADRQQISQIIGDALNLASENIQLSHSVFTHTSILVIQRQPDKSNPHLYGLSLDRPDQFTLLKDHRGCLIRHSQSNREWRLDNLQCTPVETDQ
ncbi:MAG: hypothetical protein ACPG3V_03035 [Porticoccaceae bacterium]